MDFISADTTVQDAMNMYETSVTRFNDMTMKLTEYNEIITNTKNGKLSISDMKYIKTTIDEMYNELDVQIAVTLKFIESTKGELPILYQRLAETFTIGIEIGNRTGITWVSKSIWERKISDILT